MRKGVRYIYRAILLSFVWWMLVGQDSLSWYPGGAVILCISFWGLDDAGVKKSRFRFWRLAWFAAYFLWRTMVGSCDVAWRALHPDMPIRPLTLVYRFRLPRSGYSRVVFTNCLSLSPGTLAILWHEDILLVHVITDDPSSELALRRLESQVGWMFGVSPATEFKSNGSEGMLI